jgi:hypothetical protein
MIFDECLQRGIANTYSLLCVVIGIGRKHSYEARVTRFEMDNGDRLIIFRYTNFL